MQHDNFFAHSDMDVYGTIGQANGFDPQTPIVRPAPTASPVAPAEVIEERAAAPTVIAGAQAKIFKGRVRSGSRVANETGDLIILGDVNPGAELVAAGHIHVYGAMGGRAYAGVGGHKDALVFCQRFQAELIAIAGNYISFETVPADLSDQAVQFSLENNQLVFAPLR
jgi:septum site-determining protein MinC